MGIFSIFFNKKKSKDTARDRLKLVLMHDRSDISPEVMELLRRDIVQVISKYMEVDESIDCKLSNDENVTALEVSVPVKGMKRGSKVMAELAARNGG
ncbi:MAG: cell division topological specificity factor MinE [Pyramidobacter sp.]|nr:cell division topological specificity factor MinE [Pyramidobacter sp.]